MSNLLNSCAATVQSTSGGGGLGALDMGRGEPLPKLDMLDTARRPPGEVTFAIKDWVGEEKVGGVRSRCFGSGGGGGGRIKASNCSSLCTLHHKGS